MYSCSEKLIPLDSLWSLFNHCQISPYAPEFLATVKFQISVFLGEIASYWLLERASKEPEDIHFPSSIIELAYFSLVLIKTIRSKMSKLLGSKYSVSYTVQYALKRVGISARSAAGMSFRYYERLNTVTFLVAFVPFM